MRPRLLGVRHPATHRFGVYLSLPFVLSPAAGRNGRRVEEVLRAVKILRPSLRAIDFVGDPRLVEEDEFRDRLFATMARIVELLAQMGVHLHTREGRPWWPTQSIAWLGFVVHTERGVVEIDAGKRQKGVALRDVIV